MFRAKFWIFKAYNLAVESSSFSGKESERFGTSGSWESELLAEQAWESVLPGKTASEKKWA